MKKEDPAKKYFDPKVTDRERAIFEGGIALGAIYHQFIGIPITPNKKIVGLIEKTIKEAMRLQPYKKDVQVKININKLRKPAKNMPYSYETLKGEHLDVTVKTCYGKAKATLRMRYIPKLKYTLMYVEKVSP
jgi:hypothetical protein